MNTPNESMSSCDVLQKLKMQEDIFLRQVEDLSRLVLLQHSITGENPLHQFAVCYHPWAQHVRSGRLPFQGNGHQ